VLLDLVDPTEEDRIVGTRLWMGSHLHGRVAGDEPPLCHAGDLVQDPASIDVVHRRGRDGVHHTIGAADDGDPRRRGLALISTSTKSRPNRSSSSTCHRATSEGPEPSSRVEVRISLQLVAPGGRQQKK